VTPGTRQGDATGRFSASDTTARATATAADRSAVSTVTMLMPLSAVCAVAALLDATSGGHHVPSVPSLFRLTLTSATKRREPMHNEIPAQRHSRRYCYRQQKFELYTDRTRSDPYEVGLMLLNRRPATSTHSRPSEFKAVAAT
jgi:hypothetical protein